MKALHKFPKEMVSWKWGFMAYKSEIVQTFRLYFISGYKKDLQEIVRAVKCILMTLVFYNPSSSSDHSFDTFKEKISGTSKTFVKMQNVRPYA